MTLATALKTSEAKPRYHNMENHPSYAALSSVLAKYPSSAGCLFQTYNDLLLAQQWTDLRAIDLPGCKRASLKGNRPRNQFTPTEELNLEPMNIVPCSLAESLSMDWLSTVFFELSNPKEIYLAIVADDSSLVYYKMSTGIIKPPI